MNRKELDEEIEYIHSNIPDIKLLRPFVRIWNVVVNASNTYTNLAAFMNDYINLFHKGIIDVNVFNKTLNDLYLLALLHTTCEEDLEDEK